MLQLHNHTSHQTALAVIPDREGADTAVIMLKASFPLRPGKQVAAEPIHLEDVFAGAPGRSHLIAHADLALEKPGTDVVLVGSARSRDEEPVSELMVYLQVGSVDKAIRVVGDRTWVGGLFGPHLSEPELFTSMPLTWDRAFGGMDHEDHEGAPEQFHPDNPAGRGFRLKRSATPVEGSLAPNLEPHDQPLRSAKKPIPAVNFAAIAPGWGPRLRWAGTYDERWQQERAPFLPDDFDPRFLQVAPPDQIVAEGLNGGEIIDLHGLHPDGPFQVTLPSGLPEIICDLAGARLTPRVRLDTVVIDTDRGLLSLLWRACQRCDKQALRLRSITIHGPNCRHG